MSITNSKIVQHISKAKFKIATAGVEGSELAIDFNPIIEQFKLTGDFYLFHWQARPKGHREYGIYSSSTDTYSSTDFTAMAGYGGLKLIQLNDQTASTVPSAAIWFKGVPPR